MQHIPTLLLLSSLTLHVHGQVVINEVDYDQPSIDTHEFIELKNNSLNGVDPADLRLLMLSGAGGVATVYRDLNPLTGPIIMPGDHFVICGDALATANCDMDASPDVDLIQNGAADALVLVRVSDSTILDVLSYEGDCPGNFETMGFVGGDAFWGGSGGPAEHRSLNRYPDGTDSNNNALDIIDACATPGAPNAADTLNCGPLAVEPFAMTGRTLQVFLDANADLLWMYSTFPDRDGVTFEVFGADGRLVASHRTVGGHQGSWAFAINGLRGRMLLLRASSGSMIGTARIVIP